MWIVHWKRVYKKCNGHKKRNDKDMTYGHTAKVTFSNNTDAGKTGVEISAGCQQKPNENLIWLARDKCFSIKSQLLSANTIKF